MRVLTWNLYHGRSVPPCGRPLADRFAALLASWPWDLALLQEVPPWWPQMLARACGAREHTALTSRNALLPLRQALARRRPDLMKSNGGGSNAVLSRLPVAAHESVRLALRPERRVAQLVRMGDGAVVANYHASTRVPLAEAELRKLCELTLLMANGAPAMVAGDLNLRRPQAPSPMRRLASRDVDHVLAAGLTLTGDACVHPREAEIDSAHVELSDHPPLEVELSALG